MVCQCRNINHGATVLGIGGCGCFYMNEEESCRPRDPFSVFGSDSPILGQSDNLYVSSGVLVQDRTGDKYMIISSNDFPPGTAVYQPDNDGHRVGEATAYVPNTAPCTGQT
ncbi:uncharacterized protein ASPGLDRAFT_1441557 [Aspergillus glaucus CBS 516.65]|uniref:Uncharacterized protein n=1 Tax=Aspergillus glaucus CBS 516.65 TaxID=1160497 RepID=A0A1L9VN24_ASPGL|nr:hypothetical protein ASPGLDRAFT_1441557 [Aspergillus glaucus CBS 516.65]OJJ85326.1 hypothetical protein ASPGLDRAFT_1441557 [Aspergillus glaucus CBS 516.65]